MLLLTIDAEVIVEHSHRAVGIDSDVQVFMHQKIVPRTLTNNSKVVNKRIGRLAILQRTLKALLRNASRLVLGTSGLASTANALWLKMDFATDIVAIDGERDQAVQRTRKVDDLPGTACSTGDKNGQTDIRSIVDGYRCVSWDDCNRQHGNDAQRDSQNSSFH